MARRDLISDILDIVGGATGAALLPLLTFGQVRAELRIRPNRDAALRPAQQPDGTWVVSNEVATVVGILVWVAVLAGVTKLVGR